THDREEALTLSDRIAVISDGRAVQVGTPEELYERPVSPAVAEFLGEINLFCGTVEQEPDCPVLALPTEYDLRMIFPLNDVGGIPSEGKNCVIVADVNNVLHFRIFDSGGKIVVDTDESQIPAQKSTINELRKQLQKLRLPHELSACEKRQIITEITSIVG